MARIRTIKPDFFRHEALQDAEIANPGKYPMMVFAGLWVIADREGRFEWRPRRIKLDVLPFLDFDMEQTMSILEAEGLIHRYEHSGETYGAITSWDRHQIVGRDEPPSEIPTPSGEKTLYFRPLNQTQRFKVYERDGWTCAYCARDMRNDRRAACLDHVIPYAQGGTNRELNLATSCKRCNSTKANKTPLEAGMKWPAGLGEYLDRDTNTVCHHPINDTLTGGSKRPDKEGEGVKGIGEGNGVNPAPDKPARFDPVAMPLPACLHPTDWSAWISYRRARKLTTAEPTMLKQLQFLTECNARGQPPAAIINASITNGWQGLFEQKAGGSNGKNGSSRADRISATIAELTGANRHPAAAIDGVATRVD